MDDDLIERIYDAALDPGLWPDVLDLVTTACGAASTTLMPLRELSSVVASRGHEAALASYVDQWWRHDVIAEAIIRTRRPGLFCDWLLVDPDVRARHPFYQVFRRESGYRDNVAFSVDLEPGRPFGISLQLPSTATAPPDAARLDRFSNLGRHVSRSILFAARAARTGPSPDLVSCLMATLSCGIACLDAAGRVLLANPILESFAPDGLKIVDMRLKTASRTDQAALDALVRRALVPGLPPGPVLAPVSRPNGRRAFLVGALPVSAGRQATRLPGAPHCRALITVVDPLADAPTKIEPALRSLGLSPAEARLAIWVGSGLAPREAAERLGLTESTVRTRLKLIFEKLELSRQSELARLVTQLAFVGGGR